MAIATNLGFPRIGANRQLKHALESYWQDSKNLEHLLETGKNLRAITWQEQLKQGIDHIPCNDFSFYDHVLDTALLLGATPSRYDGLKTDLYKHYFAMARGLQDQKIDLSAMEMTKWFDTNYHYIVPELDQSTKFHLSFNKPLSEYQEAAKLGIQTRPVLLGPISFLLLSKIVKGSAFEFLSQLLPVYINLLKNLQSAGIDWVQIDEPCLVLDLSKEMQQAFVKAYEQIAKEINKTKILLTTYFGHLGDNLTLAASLPVSGLHIDLVRAPEQLEPILKFLPKDRYLSAGVIDGRNIWRTNLDQVFSKLSQIAELRDSDKLMIAPSCSLLHCPVSLDQETKLDPELKSWLAFSTEKLAEISALSQAINTGKCDNEIFEQSRYNYNSRTNSKKVHVPEVAKLLKNVSPDMYQRKSKYPKRQKAQLELKLPFFPTTTIGSFPQTKEIRSIRSQFRNGKCSKKHYEEFMENEIKKAIHWQEDIGLDVLVHGEFERNDMVEYFGEKLEGFAFTENGWVQSYGSRCVKPPIIFGDISRSQPMTVKWSSYAQSLTKKPVKGMLTGPVTILQWSFVRDDQPRSLTCQQIALAIRQEVFDLEQAGLKIIQIDEPALREGLPLRKKDWQEYLNWAVNCFRLASSCVQDSTQIHTHMCYSEFNDIIEAIAALDADVISMETSRSNCELLTTFANFQYPNCIGPGVYDIHSPRIPSKEEIATLLTEAAKSLHVNQLWVNPDCGLKTRQWNEVKPALSAMVSAAQMMRNN